MHRSMETLALGKGDISQNTPQPIREQERNVGNFTDNSDREANKHNNQNQSLDKTQIGGSQSDYANRKVLAAKFLQDKDRVVTGHKCRLCKHNGKKLEQIKKETDTAMPNIQKDVRYKALP